MIYVTNPIYGYVKKILETTGANGGKFKKYIIGTSSKDKEGVKEYSDWFCVLGGLAREKEEELQEKMHITITKCVLTNVAKKNEDGSWGKNYLNIRILDFEVKEFEDSSKKEDDGEDSPF